MSPQLRKVALTAHVAASVGWFGAVATFLVLAIIGLTTQDTLRARAAYLAMEMISGAVIVPLSLAALLTGLVQALGTPWGLFRHYWVLVKLLLTVFATLVLFLHLDPIRRLAAVATETTVSGANYRSLQVQLVAGAGAALAVLFSTTMLGVLKPKGLTPYGWRKQNEKRPARQP